MPKFNLKQVHNSDLKKKKTKTAHYFPGHISVSTCRCKQVTIMTQGQVLQKGTVSENTQKNTQE